MTVEYLFGVCVGIIFVFLLFSALLIFMHKDKELKPKYDERQNYVRGKAFKCGFFSLIICNAIYMVFSEAIDKTFEPKITICIISVLGCLVYAGYSIFNEAYLGLNEKPLISVIAFSIIGIINLAIGIVSFNERGVMENGRIGLQAMNFVCGIMMFIIVFMLLIKMCINKKEVD